MMGKRMIAMFSLGSVSCSVAVLLGSVVFVICSVPSCYSFSLGVTHGVGKFSSCATTTRRRNNDWRVSNDVNREHVGVGVGVGVGLSSNNSIRRRTTSLGSSMINYEELSARLPSKAVIDAVEELSPGDVIASDIAASAGVSLSQARKDLTALASLSRGDIAVSSEGELIYRFPNNLSSVLSGNSLKFRARSILQKIWPPLFYATRVSFGVALLVSIFAIFSTIAIISSSSSSDDRDRGGRDRGGGGGGGGMSFGGGFFWGPSPLDFFYYRPYYGYYGSPRSARYRDPDEMGFLESTFSYIFGDGDPNQGVGERQLKLVSQLIRDNGGAVTAEQLAPFVLDGDDLPAFDDDVDDVDSTRYVDESYVLPLVTQLGGEPQVTEEGDIVYLFPELLQTGTTTIRTTTASLLQRAQLPPDASSADIKNELLERGLNPSVFVRGMEKDQLFYLLQESLLDDGDDDTTSSEFLQEREYKFSVATKLNQILAGGLGALNLGGALYLGNMLSSPALEGVRLPSYFGLVQTGYPLLLGYAVLYNLIPLGRKFWLSARNDNIKRRNERRRQWRTRFLAATAGRIARKLKQAKTMSRNLDRLSSSGTAAAEVVFDTANSAQDLEVDRERDSMREFDKLLGDSEFE